MRTLLLTLLALLAFAANSILCRWALLDPANSPLSFTALRLMAGAAFLGLLFLRPRRPLEFGLTWPKFLAPGLLFSYALFFSLGYTRINAATGAMILFASVQLSMMTVACLQGHRLGWGEGTGFILAAGGLLYLLLPGLGRPDPEAAALMLLAGCAWGGYTILGKGSGDPALMTTRNFVSSLPLCLGLLLLYPIQLSGKGWALALLSGSITSGLGYVIWYRALKNLHATTAAIAQLSVPPIAALGGVIFLGEKLSLRLGIASAAILAGIVIKIRSSSR